LEFEDVVQRGGDGVGSKDIGLLEEVEEIVLVEGVQQNPFDHFYAVVEVLSEDVEDL
jgi:hypothetical protein